MGFFGHGRSLSVSKDPTRIHIVHRQPGPHPNAAKLMIRWYMGDKEGGKGYEPYHTIGDLPTRTDVALLEGSFGWDVARDKLWALDYDWCYLNLPDIRDFWTVQLGE